jgi:glycosyl hydrolase family 42 (putative beta-galactosidase)
MLPRPLICLTFLMTISLCAAGSADDLLFDFENNFDLTSVDRRDVEAELTKVDGTTWLELKTGTKQRWPGITLKPAKGIWNLSEFHQVALDVKNLGSQTVQVSCRLDTPDFDGERAFYTENIEVAPGAQTTLTTTLRRRLPTQLKDKLYGMRGYPGGCLTDQGINPAQIDAILIFVADPKTEHQFLINNIRAVGTATQDELPETAEELFPLIDKFGQYVHKDWPGKTHSEADLKDAIVAEEQDFQYHPSPTDWNEYGGWMAGPALKATGHFYPAKHDGKWWLVDPTGRLFWSHGIDCVRSGNATTPITDREHYYAEMPDRDSPFGKFYGKGWWAPHGYYQGKPYDTYNFTGANLLRKYGEDWETTHRDLCHQRLRNWGMNTIANWSDQNIYLMRKTPYVVSIHTSRKPIEGSEGYWGKFPDPFEPTFRTSLDKRLAAEKDKSADDPWCIGYFVDNELGWGEELSLATAALASPPEQAAKQAFVADLKAKYTDIKNLNKAWGTGHASWDALLESKTPPDEAKAREDLEAFSTRIAEEYFRVCKAAVKAAAPNTMYLGCRFAWVHDRAVRAAAKFCDVVSFNKYSYTVADLELPEGVDKPVVIGEFHFGALDRGMFHTGLKPVADQNERAATYASYVRGALEHTNIVGTHWFQFGEQATTGRGDGENYQIGFLDVCDTPYPETIQACREVGTQMYEIRSGQ